MGPGFDGRVGCASPRQRPEPRPCHSPRPAGSESRCSKKMLLKSGPLAQPRSEHLGCVAPARDGCAVHGSGAPARLTRTLSLAGHQGEATQSEGRFPGGISVLAFQRALLRVRRAGVTGVLCAPGLPHLDPGARLPPRGTPAGPR